MNAETLFSIANTIALVGWLLLLVLPYQKPLFIIMTGSIVLLLCIAYTGLAFSSIAVADLKGFGSLAGIKTLFQKDDVLLAGWIHYLAFDLLTGISIKRTGREKGIAIGWLLPALLATFLLGPFGYLLFRIVLLLKTKKLFFTSTTEQA